MTACDVIVLPSTDLEGYGYVLLEAMSIGKPTIGTRIGGIPETIEDGITGLVVPPADVAALAGALERILTDRELAKRMGQAGQARVRRLFSMGKMVSSLETLYESDLNRGKG
jgi:glycosyltransferase involved in cell wall biosynthesis